MKDWTDDEILLLIDLLESNPCLWDIHHKDYSKRDLKEIAYSDIAESFDTNIASIKTKINSLRTQFGKELTKERSTKSGQSTDELYSSNWTHFDKLAFLTLVFGASKSRDTLKRMSKNEQDDENDRKVIPNKSRKTIAEKKLDLLSKCTEAFTANTKPKANESPNPKLSAFTVYVDEKSSELKKRDRRRAEKWISDVLFDIEMTTDTSTGGGSIHPQRNQFVAYNFQAVLRMQQAMPIMSQSAPGVLQQGQTPGTFDMQPGQSYVDMINKYFLFVICLLVFFKR